MEVMTFAKNETIQHPGSRCTRIYVVLDGIARIFYLKDGIDYTEHFALQNNMIIRAESLFTEQPTEKGIAAITPVTVASFSAPGLFNLFPEHHDLEQWFHKLVIQEYIHTLKRVESLQMKSAAERYQELLDSTPWVNLIPLKFLASYLGITQVSLSRIRGQR